jgi:hypothetical protein
MSNAIAEKIAQSPILALLVMLPVMIALVVGIYAVMFGFYYHAWREIFGASAEPADELAV